MTRLRLGLFGGAFDPVHEGHLDLARHCAEELRLDQLRFLPTRRPAHKPTAGAGPFHRQAMLALALAERSDFLADPRELRRDGVSYTIDTLEELGREMPDAELFFLAGADSLRDLPTWRRWEEILDRCTFVAVGRAGVRLDGDAVTRVELTRDERIRLLAHEPPSFSSRELRRQIGTGDVPEGALPAAVAVYIRKHGLYATTDQP